MLHLHRSHQADALVGDLARLLSQVPGDPFAREVVGVPTRGVERWLAQSLAGTLGARDGRADGVVANVDFTTLRAVVDRAVAGALGLRDDEDPWAAERLLWPLLEVVDAHLDEPWLGVLAGHLSRTGAGSAPRRLAAVRHVARLFDRYALHRPGMLRSWRDGADVDGSGRALAADVAWQAELWRRTAERIDAPDPVTRLTDAVRRLGAGQGTLDLPDRLSLFGLTRLPPTHLEVLEALAAHRDVHLFLLHPSPALWDRLTALAPSSTPLRADDPTARSPRNRLLTSWGRDVRELQVLLAATGTHGHGTDDRQAGGATPDVGPPTLLRRLQSDVVHDRDAPGTPAGGRPDDRAPLAADDRSVQVHACHGRGRQVEVLRDAILHTLSEDATLEPRDVLVLCPDIEAFAPLVRATFGTDAAHVGAGWPPDLRVRLADRALRQTNPVLGTIDRLLELAGGRLGAPDVLDLAGRAPVRRRFGFSDDDLARATRWLADAEVRWGLDAEHRGPFRLASVDANTWRAGLDRLLVGVATTEDAEQLVGGTLPLDDVGSTEIDLAGRLTELLDRLDDLVARFAERRPFAEWADELARAADLLCHTSEADTWQRLELDGLLRDLVLEGRDAPSSPLSLDEVRDLLGDHLRGRPSRANFRTGHLTVCTLQPMRSVPHRVVCLLGLDEGTFPRGAPRDGDDLVLADPHVGDQDGRSEDRQTLLDALMAAGDRLIVTYTGADERTNARRPPAVPVGELLDVIDQTVRVPSDAPMVDAPTGGVPASSRVVTEHPLQPFDPRNFAAGEPFGFDEVALGAAVALDAQRANGGPGTGDGRPFLAARLERRVETTVDLGQLISFLQHPARAFLRQRLGVSLPRDAEELPAELPVDLDPLEQWAVGDRLVRAFRGRGDDDRAAAAERARGCLPPGELGAALLATLGRDARLVADAARDLVGPSVDLGSLDVRVRVPVGDGLVHLSGTVAGVRPGEAGVDAPTVVEVVQYSRLGPKHRLAAWVRLLALTATRPEERYEVVTVGRLRSGGKKDKASISVSRISSPGDDAASRRTAAVEALALLLDLRDRGMREPPPLWCATSNAYVEHGPRTKPHKSASKVWETTWKFDHEDKDAEHQLLLGGVVPYDVLEALEPHDDEVGPGWDETDPSRAGRWATRLWTPLLAAETRSDV
ncbi:exodeoxyribonuclease V subunit gamma [Patulibacter sp.]|uniref:exodeoxyribonuclease V subunit gamma n=1 Tax=Patulibacter sp. TaxID=1912859 RepID=UPI002715D996|nr:exodeoxyribonuclease V subunit gamma [Patulibacter sp.]MDO9410098.1 exodeoxyribonuclease V subunit gamma [Patulibacter sp.]